MITNPGHRTYELGESITAFGITATDADSDPVTLTVTGLPPGLSYTNGQVRGTVSTGAAAKDYAATVTADDGVNAAVTAAFTVTVLRDRTRPTVSIDGPVQAQRGAFWVSIVFSEPVEGFEQTDVTVGNGGRAQVHGFGRQLPGRGTDHAGVFGDGDGRRGGGRGRGSRRRRQPGGESLLGGGRPEPPDDDRQRSVGGAGRSV